MKVKNLSLVALLLLIFISLFAQEGGDGNTGDPTKLGEILLFSVLGLVIQEFIYWYELRNDIAKGNIPNKLTSKAYWIITGLSIIIFSAGSCFYFLSLESDSSFFTIAIFSAGFSRLFKGAVQQLGNREEEEGVLEEEKRFNLAEYLMIRK